MSNNTSLKYLNDYIYGSSGYESGIPDSGGGTTGATPDSQANMIVTSELISEMSVEKGWTDSEVQNIISGNVTTNYRIDKCLNYGELKNMSTLLELNAPYSTDNRLVLKKHVNILSPFKEIPIIFTCVNGYIPRESISWTITEEDSELGDNTSEFLLPSLNVISGASCEETIKYNPRKTTKLFYHGYFNNDDVDSYLEKYECEITTSTDDDKIIIEDLNTPITINENIVKIEFKAEISNIGDTPSNDFSVLRNMYISVYNYGSSGIAYQVSYYDVNYPDDIKYIVTSENNSITVVPEKREDIDFYYQRTNWQFQYPIHSDVTLNSICILINLDENDASYFTNEYYANFEKGDEIRVTKLSDKVLELNVGYWSPLLGNINVTFGGSN